MGYKLLLESIVMRAIVMVGVYIFFDVWYIITHYYRDLIHESLQTINNTNMNRCSPKRSIHRGRQEIRAQLTQIIPYGQNKHTQP